MKKISEHLGEIIVALAVVALIISVVTVFSAPVSNFFSSIVTKEVALGTEVMNGMAIGDIGVDGSGDASAKYQIIAGSGQTYSTGQLSFTSNAPFDKFAGVKVNNEVVDPVNYTVTEGSTIITFTEAYSQLLANGDYEIEVLATDGKASAPFDVDISGGGSENISNVKIGNIHTKSSLSTYGLNQWSGNYSHSNKWQAVTFTGLSGFSGSGVWTDGTNTYYSYRENAFGFAEGHYILNGNTWEEKTWEFDGQDMCGTDIWTNGTNIYNSYYENYVLDKGTDYWEYKRFKGATIAGLNVWTDGTNIYFSQGSNHSVLRNDNWMTKTWSGLTSFTGYNVWSDGSKTYYSEGSKQYVLNGSTWEEKTWNGFSDIYGEYIWTDGTNTYYSYEADQYVLNGNTWEEVNWTGMTEFYGNRVWTNGTNIYCSSGSGSYILK